MVSYTHTNTHTNICLVQLFAYFKRLLTRKKQPKATRSQICICVYLNLWNIVVWLCACLTSSKKKLVRRAVSSHCRRFWEALKKTATGTVCQCVNNKCGGNRARILCTKSRVTRAYRGCGIACVYHLVRKDERSTICVCWSRLWSERCFRVRSCVWSTVNKFDVWPASDSRVLGKQTDNHHHRVWSI